MIAVMIVPAILKAGSLLLIHYITYIGLYPIKVKR